MVKQTCPFRIWLMRSHITTLTSVCVQKSKNTFSHLPMFNISVYMIYIYNNNIIIQGAWKSIWTKFSQFVFHSYKNQLWVDTVSWVEACLLLKHFPLSIPCGCVRDGGSTTAIINEIFASRNKSVVAHTQWRKKLRHEDILTRGVVEFGGANVIF